MQPYQTSFLSCVQKRAVQFLDARSAVQSTLSARTKQYTDARRKFATLVGSYSQNRMLLKMQARTRFCSTIRASMPSITLRHNLKPIDF